MKRIIALLLAVLYLFFTTFGVVHMGAEADIAFYEAKGSTEYIITDDASADQQIVTDKHLLKAPRHLQASGKIKVPRNSFVVLLFRKAFSPSSADSFQLPERVAPPHLYHAALFLKHSVLRI